MATITVKITTKAADTTPSVKGESQIAGHVDEIEALGIRETIDVGVSSGGGTGRARHSDIELIRYKDSASAKLADACANAINLNFATISVYRTMATGALWYMQYDLTDTYVSRIEHETLDEEHVALRPHLAEMNRGLPLPGAAGLATALGSTVADALSSTRLMVLPVEQIEAFSNLEIERVTLNFNKIKWRYRTFKVSGGVDATTEKGFDLLSHSALTA